MTVALFVTCLTDAFRPRAAEAVVRVLEHLGYEVAFPEQQTCCGQPMLNNGMPREAASLVRRLADVFAGYEAVVTPSASCAAMVRVHAPHLFDEGTDRDAVTGLCERLYEFSEFLTTVHGFDPAAAGVEWQGSITCHRPCHLRGLCDPELSEHLLDRVPGLERRPLPRVEQCCGFGGTFSLRFPSISGALVDDKVTDIQSTGAQAVVCNDAGCAMNIGGGCHRAGTSISMTTVAEIIAEGLGLMSPEPTDD